MYAPDLSTQCQVASGDAVRAIGWLEHGKPFTTGSADRQFLSVLRTQATDLGRWMPFAAAGKHTCDLGGCGRASAAGFVFIPTTTCIYAAPELVVHYVEHHDYAPPAEFVAAVLACPEQSTDAYVKLILPFAKIWSLDPDGVRSIAINASSHRKKFQRS